VYPTLCGAAEEPTTTRFPPAPLPVSGMAAQEDATEPAPSGEAAWGYVSCRNALSESGSLVTASTLKRGEDALNPFTMQ
jgi:hypothetical protein